MTRWYRAYAGTVKDDKLAEAAIVAGCSRSVAIAVWHALLESAAETDDGGRFETTARRVAAILGEPAAAIDAMFGAMTEIGMIEGNAIAAWKRRQFESDSSTERSRKHREAKRNGDPAPSNGDATLQQRSATPPETEAETDTDPTVSNELVGVRAKARRPEHAQILDCLKTVLSEDRAKAVIEHRRKMKKPLGLHAAKLLVEQFRQLAEPDKAADLMLLRGWQGCEPDWCVKAGLKLSTACAAMPGQPDRIFVKRDTDEWFARVAAGHKPGLSKFYPEHQAEGWLFSAQVHH